MRLRCCVALLEKNSKKPKSLAEKLTNEYGSINAFAVQADVSRLWKRLQNVWRNWQPFRKSWCPCQQCRIAQQKLFTGHNSRWMEENDGVNLDGVFYCLQQALKRYMIKTTAVLFSISAQCRDRSVRLVRCITVRQKAGVIGLTKVLPRRSVCRGACQLYLCVIMTDMMKGFDEQTVQDLKKLRLICSGMPDDIAETSFVFLCSDRARFITGTDCRCERRNDFNLIRVWKTVGIWFPTVIFTVFIYVKWVCFCRWEYRQWFLSSIWYLTPFDFR